MQKSAKAEMMIRKPIEKVFEAFIDPAITSKFWFTQGSAKLNPGASINWIWEMYDLTVPVKVLSIEDNKSINIEWGSDEHLSKATWEFKALTPNKTFVQITNFDFLGTKEEVTNQVIDSTGGFTMLLAGAKAWLEHGIELGLIGDKFPEEMRG